ncbi:MAG TPA: Gfo/Idh/MocA family oxidoreductase [Isosphaeraceae bacterium]|nr:Gfo/Idh/MocA family oxidoreductase [Isosphaeraceae bacterium]
MANVIRRREFFRRAGAAGALAWTAPLWADVKSPNEKLNIGVIGTANRASANIDGVRGENIVAICDIDDNYLSSAHEQFPAAKVYHDFRKLVDHPGLDAIVVSTPDHTHAPATMAGIERGLHVYCEKPMTHTVYEARKIAEAARAKGVATQLGTQIHAGDNYRRVVELIRAGAIGPVREVHVWCYRAWTAGDRPTNNPPVPPNIHWDLWLGPAPERPYNPTYLPANWRSWWAFGNGTLGDMACHHMDLSFWALDLRYPSKVTAEGPPVSPESAPAGLKVRYEHPAKGDRPAVVLHWYDGDMAPPELMRKPGMPKWGNGTLFVGDDGMLLADYGNHVLLPQEKFRDYKKPEPSIPSSIGHYAEWIKACKTGSPTSCNFDYSGALTEAVLLGVVAFRSGESLDWDAQALKATNTDKADNYLRREYRKGWAFGSL